VPAQASDLVNVGESYLASLHVLVVRMNVGLLGKRRVVMARARGGWHGSDADL
jgi:hypothetical protein